MSDSACSFLSPSTFCERGLLFKAWLEHFEVEHTQSSDESPFWQRRSGGKFDIEITGYDFPPPPANPSHALLHERLKGFFTFHPTEAGDDVAKDEYAICENASMLCSTYDKFSRLSDDCQEATFRAPIDNLFDLVFSHSAGFHVELETAMVLPALPEEIRRQLKFTATSTTSADITASSFARTTTTPKISLLDTELHAFRPQLVEFTRNHIALAEVFMEYKTNDLDTVRRQVMLDHTITLFHRRYVGLDSRPVHGIAINNKTAYYFSSVWKDGIATSTEYQQALSLATFSDWIGFYISLVKIRQTITSVPTVDVVAARERKAWRNIPSESGGSRRRREDSQEGDDRPRKKRKTASDAFQPEGGGGYSFEDDVQSWSPVSASEKVHEYLQGLRVVSANNSLAQRQDE
ncbi:hypothetical protein EXIGLDRAFT_726074, partial [Exidia glandulosa HHB12029]